MYSVIEFFFLNSNYPSLGITSSGVQERTGSKVLSQSANGISGQNRKADKVPGTGELLASGEELFFTPNLNVNTEGSLTQGDRLNLIKASRRAHQVLRQNAHTALEHASAAFSASDQLLGNGYSSASYTAGHHQQHVQNSSDLK